MPGRVIPLLTMFLLFSGSFVFPGVCESEWVTFEGNEGPGKGKQIVFVTGDEEYRSEEGMTQLAKILAKHHGFRCTVLYAIDPETGEIDPVVLDNIPGLEALDQADLMVLFTRFRELPDEQMKHIVDYTLSGKPIIGLRTATHAFFYRKRKESPYAKYSYNSNDPKGGWGRWVLGETWIAHHGHHGVESTRGVIAEGQESHPIVRGCEDIWGPTDVYAITELEGECTPLVLGQVLSGMDPDDPPNNDKEMLPVAWTKRFEGNPDKPARVFTTTMGASQDLLSEGLRRLLVNAVYWCLEMEDRIPPKNEVSLVGEYDPSPFGFGGHKKGVHPQDLKDSF